MRAVKRSEEAIRADAMASNLLNNDYDSFWTDVKKLNSSNAIISNLIDGTSGESNITNLWKKHFCNILNANTCDSDLKNKIMTKLENIQHTDDMTVSGIDISNLISQLKYGKAAGSDDLCAEYFKFAHNKLHILLSMCFTLFFTHSYLSATMIETIIVPIVKNKCGNLCDSNNYRPIALATLMSKLFESVILLKCETFLETCPNQFGFKNGHSTEMCIYVLKEMIEFYKSCNTSVFVTFLDASKAYDKIDHWLLYDKLLHNDVPVFIVKILVYWYSHQEMFIRWGNSCSNKFYVTNGVKQGGILSPALFNVYMNNLSVTLNQSGIGGFLGESLVNHICYADDLCLIALSSSGMQHLLDLCSVYATNHQLSYNATKSFSLCFKPNRIKIKPPDFALGEKVIPSVDQCKYLGIIISVKNCDADLKRQMRKYYANANMLLRKFSYCSPDVKCCMFKSYCSTMYCSSMWFDSTVTDMRKLKIAYNNGLRRILNLPKYNSASEMFVNLNIPSFDELLRKFVYSFKSRIQDSCNSLVNGIVKSSVPLFSKIWVWWSDILYT